MCLVLSLGVTSALDTISFALGGLDVNQSLNVISALVTHTG
jgi:hypothetical protein